MFFAKFAVSYDRPHSKSPEEEQESCSIEMTTDSTLMLVQDEFYRIFILLLSF